MRQGATVNQKMNRNSATTSVPALASSESTLVSLAKIGDRSAYSELCRRHSKQIFHTAYRVTGNREDAEDVVQDSLMKALIHLKGFDGRSAFSTWLTRIAINSALMLKRKGSNRTQLSLDSHDDPDLNASMQVADRSLNAEDQFILSQRRTQILMAVKGLPTNLRIPVELQLMHDVSVKELALLAGISVAATKSRLLRARLRLRRSVVANHL